MTLKPGQLQKLQDDLKMQQRVEICLYGFQARYPDRPTPTAEELAEIADVSVEIAASTLNIMGVTARRPAPYSKPRLVFCRHWRYHVARYKQLSREGDPTLKDLIATSGIPETTLLRYLKNRQKQS